MSGETLATALQEHQRRNHRLQLDLEQKGVDLDEPRPIDCHFWAWTQRDAAVLAKSLYQMGY
jgi:hypothetical protein